MRGIDVSSWQHVGGKPIDWHAAAESGVGFALVKATQGTAYVSPWLDRDLSDAFAAGLLVGAYHYFEAGVDPVAQAQAFIGALIGHRLELGAWLDWEPAPMPGWQAAAAVKAFTDAAEEARPGLGLYCDETWYAELRTANTEVRRLWLAAPSLAAPPQGALLWQRGTTTVPGIVGAVDVDELVSARGLNIPTSPPPRPSAATAVPVRLPAEAVDPDD